MNYDDEIQSELNNNNERDVEMAREYCDEHEFYYKTHTCEPQWEKNGDLEKYIVELHDNQKVRDAFVKKRNKERNHTPKKYKKRD